MSNIIVSIMSYFLYRFLGEITFMKNPLTYVQEMNQFFEETFYKDSLFRGALLVMFVITIVGFFAAAIVLFLAELPLSINIFFSSIIAMLYFSSIYLTNKNLNTLIIAPLFYLAVFGLFGLIIYKTVSVVSALVSQKHKLF